MTLEQDGSVIREMVGNEAHSVSIMYEMMAPLLDGAEIVLLGAATHGTREFYDIRAEITARLVQERGFDIVALEADWPEVRHVNMYVSGYDEMADSRDALSAFTHFPDWM